MPTTLPRFQVTETPVVERALRVAAETWPGVARPELVNRLFEAAVAAIEARRGDAELARIGAVDLSAGAFDLAYGPDYLERLRDEWPE
ncbi:hypothetical protein ET445_01160 [Agromyces protaetiae]|uniref:Uncharacterized protein n=1 Tax=Agromyces protaetiae TaxID=2509455 RepID=A0A4P6FNU5_9MICO|nr:hypothetical protein [Agromyces protaetiae]QAY72148.1 hypothetical protein ET445_01160 [Agromyces protaetiae]